MKTTDWTGTGTMTTPQFAADAASTTVGGVLLRVATAGVRSSQPITLAGRVLLAEDGPENQHIISLYLRKAGAQVVLAENGRIAVELVKSQPLDLILMDIEMPELDGYAATRRLRLEGCTLPIIALTAHSAAEHQDKCLAAGCTDFVAKPIERNSLLASVAGHLVGSRQEYRPANGSDCRPEAAAAPAPPAAREPAATTATVKSSFDHEPAMQEAIAQFVAMLPGRVAGMQKLLADRDLDELRRVVHQIRGAGGGYGFDDITRFATQTDCALRKENPLETIAGEVDLLIALIRSVEGYQPSRELFHG